MSLWSEQCDGQIAGEHIHIEQSMEGGGVALVAVSGEWWRWRGEFDETITLQMKWSLYEERAVYTGQVAVRVR